MDNHECSFSFSYVLPASALLLCKLLSRQIKNVILHLKCHSDAFSENPEFFNKFTVCVSNHRRKSSCHPRQSPSFVSAHLQVILFAQSIRVCHALMPRDIHRLPHAEVNHLLHVNLVDISEFLRRKMCPPLHQRQKRQIIHCVSRVDRYVNAVNPVCAWFTPPELGRVLDVVDYQSAVMDDFWNNSKIHVVVRVLA